MTVAAQPLGDRSTSEEELRTLLAIGGEVDDPDPKEHLDLSQHKDKGFAAMQSNPTGGYVVVGADDRGKPEGPRESRLSLPPLGSPGHRSSTVFGRDAAAPASYPSPIMTA